MKCIFPFLLLLLLASCGREEEPMDLSHDYMPLSINRFWVYEVEETIYFGEGDQETSQYYLRDIITNSYINNDGVLVYMVNRQKSMDQLNWVEKSTHSFHIKNNALVRHSENKTLVVLVFPPKDLAAWDGNIYNSENTDEYSMVLLNSYDLNPGLYNRVTKVTQENEDDQITIRDNRYEVYAKNVGMIEQYHEVLTYCSRNDCLGDQIIDGGSFRHLKLIDNGQLQ
ncbi:hypothetical protein QWY93_16245 [Echinicola jeungdonensis]|uniref:NigD-like protein n=1 Tax=Echinicola jeungdonensis TaxID=709343 RepID=A0ABV5J5F9_9BACT|nr:hypothetical protein [Echinicola jeungdonensis]MDN3670872.1 hypothetical protein [Echinicola jeungdonensis]